jgi:hypothetical protein
VVALADGETIVVKADGSPVTTKSLLQTGTLLTISGGIATSNTTSRDAFYGEPVQQGAQPSFGDGLYVKSAFPGSTTQGALSAFLFARPAYQSSHVYHVEVGSELGPATFTCSFCGQSTPYSGSYTVAISGPGAASSGGSGSGGGSSALPPLSSSSATPTLGVTTDYAIEALGAVGTYKTPAIGGSREEETDISFVDDQGNRVAGPTLGALEAQAGKASAVCHILALPASDAPPTASDFGVHLPEFARCVDVVARVLARADQIRQQKGTGRAAAAATCCPQLVHRTKGAKATLRVSCTQTATGARITIRPTARGQTLRQALRGHPLRLLIGRSSIPAPGGTPARLRVRWTAH